MFSRKLELSGVGSAGTAGARKLLNCVLLDGVPGDLSEASSRFASDTFLLLMLRRLDDEKFLRILCAIGDPDRPFASSPSTRPRLLGGDPRVIG